MERRLSSRVQVQIPILAFVEGTSFACRAVELSVTGMVFERSRNVGRRPRSALRRFEIYLGARPIRARARAVWSGDRLEAVSFLLMNDADRLTIAEHLDRMTRLKEP